MAEYNDMVNVKINDEEDADKFNDFKEKSDDEKEFNIQGNLESSDEDSDEDDDGDTAELLAGKKKAPPFWSFEYYQTFFDIDTSQVLRRILGSMVPVRKRNFLTTQIRSNPDLYGPFWVCATLVVTIAISGNLANYLIHAGDHNWTYDFHKITFAAVAIFTYAWLVPVGVWSVLTWRGNTAGYSFLEIICVYGYSLSIFIPISILWVIPFELVRWIIMIIGLCLSGAVLVLTFWPAVRDDNKKVACAVLLVIFLLHGSLAIGFKLYFFHSPPPVDTPVSKPTGPPKSAPSTTTKPPSLAERTVSTKPRANKDRK